jgi:hypothetical protein
LREPRERKSYSVKAYTEGKCGYKGVGYRVGDRIARFEIHLPFEKSMSVRDFFCDLYQSPSLSVTATRHGEQSTTKIIPALVICAVLIFIQDGWNLRPAKSRYKLRFQFQPWLHLDTLNAPLTSGGPSSDVPTQPTQPTPPTRYNIPEDTLAPHRAPAFLPRTSDDARSTARHGQSRYQSSVSWTMYSANR